MSDTTSTRAQDFTAVLDLPVSPDDVVSLFTSAAGVSRWWGPTEGDAAVGGTLITSFGEHGVNATRVLEAGPDRVVWEPVAAPGTTPTGHTREWLGTTIQIDIHPAGNGTELRFRHVGLNPELECWDACYDAWSYFMGSIGSCVKTGVGTPFGA
ncbi:MAG: SRPBCC family protein [Pseudonocardiaceae bacterium]